MKLRLTILSLMLGTLTSLSAYAVSPEEGLWSLQNIKCSSGSSADARSTSAIGLVSLELRNQKAAVYISPQRGCKASYTGNYSVVNGSLDIGVVNLSSNDCPNFKALSTLTVEKANISFPKNNTMVVRVTPNGGDSSSCPAGDVVIQEWMQIL
jgi:hypothetical protein